MIPRDIETHPEVHLRRSFLGNEAQPFLKRDLGALMALKIELYGTPWCPDTRRVRLFLQSRGIPFTEIDIETDFDAGERLFNGTGRYVVPYLRVSQEYWLRGFDPPHPTRLDVPRLISSLQAIVGGEFQGEVEGQANGGAFIPTTQL